MSTAPPPAFTAIAPPNERIRLYLSGGSNRAALGAVGAITYMATTPTSAYRWRAVDEVIGLSGGSQPIAAMLAGLERPGADGQYDGPRTVESLSRFYQAMVYHSKHHRPSRRYWLLLQLLALLAIPVTCFVLTFFGPGFLAFLFGLLSLPVVYRVGAGILYRYLRSFIDDVVRAARSPLPVDASGKVSLAPETKLERKTSMVQKTAAASHLRPNAQMTTRSYFIVVTGMATSYPYAYFAGQGFAACPPGVSQSEHSAIEACAASCSLPPLSQRGEPPVAWLDPPSQPNARTEPKNPPAREALLDGGYGGNFGVQIVNKVAREIATTATGQTVAGAPRPLKVHPDDRRVLALDAGRPARNTSRFLPLVRAISTVVRLIRVIEVGNAATYRNDLEDLEDADGGIIALSQTEGLTVTAVNDDRPKINNHLLRAINTNAKLGLTSVNEESAALAVAVGVVSLYLADIDRRRELGVAAYAREDDVSLHLRRIGRTLGLENPHLLDEVWKRTTGGMGKAA